MTSSSAKATADGLDNVDVIVEEHFNHEAKLVMEQARKEAMTLGHARIRSSHILLALAKCDLGVGGAVLRSFDVSAEGILSSMNKFFQNEQATNMKPKWSTGALNVMQKSINILFRYNNCDKVDTGNLLLSLLVSSSENHASKIFLDLGLSREEVLEEICRLLDPDSVKQVLGSILGSQGITSEDDEREFREWLAFVQNGCRVEQLKNPKRLSLFEAHLATRIHPNRATPEVDHSTRISPEFLAVLLMARGDNRVVDCERFLELARHFCLPS